MANANTPKGGIPYRYISGEHYNGAANTYYVPASYASNIFVGDPVIVVDNSADANGVPAVQLATAGNSNYLTGFVVSIGQFGGDPEQTIAITRDLPIYHQASTAGYVMVADDPTLMFWLQEDSVGGALAAGAASRNANLVSGPGSTVTGYSGWQLQSSSIGTSNVLQMRIFSGLVQTDNAIGVNAKWLCQMNLASLNNTTGV